MEYTKRFSFNRKRKLKLALVLFAVLFILAWYGLNANFRPALENTAYVRVDMQASDAMYRAVLDMLADEAPEPLVDIYSDGGQVLYGQVQSQRLNVFAAACAQRAQEYLDAAGEKGIRVPIGTVSGLPLFSGHGPNVLVSFTSESNVYAKLNSEFRSAGINQTLHRVSIELNARICVVVPGGTFNVNSVAQVPIVETIIVGNIPETYANVGDKPQILNLVP